MTTQVHSIQSEKTHAANPASAQNNLYRLGGWGALGVIAAAAVQAPVFILYPPPVTIAGHFAQLHNRVLVGLLDLDLTLLLAEAFSVLVFVGLFAALRSSAPASSAVALGLGLSGIGLFFAVNPTLSLLYLSDQYYAAADAAQKAALLAAGEALWANYNGTAFGMFFVLTGLGNLIFARLMLNDPAFGKPIAFTGFMMGAMLLFPPLPPFGALPLVMSYLVIIPSIAWQALVARALFRLAKKEA